jgi:2-isopropylmalate synthase
MTPEKTVSTEHSANSTDKNHVKIFDTTLRDGEQAPGFSMSTAGKLVLARELARLNVDVIEAGFAAASPGDMAAVKAVAEEIGGADNGPAICSLARLNIRDIDAAAEAISPAKKRRIHTFIGTSPLHRDAKLKMSKAQILSAITDLVAHARSACADVEFSPEDAIRTERDYLLETVQAAIEAGASTINIPDTVGYTTPEEIQDLFAFLTSEVPGADTVTFSTHCHDDLGLAVANSLAAVRGGARQIECAVNGIGERAGNCSLEEAVMALATRRDHFGLTTQINTPRLYPTSVALTQVTHQPIARNKAIVGKNAFAHEAGIHQHGVLANRRTYEIMDAEAVGMPSNSIVLAAEQPRLDELFVKFKALADTQREVTDNDLVRLVTGSNMPPGRSGPWRLRQVEMQYGVDAEHKPNARVTMEHEDGTSKTVIGEGQGPFDAAFHAVCAIADVAGQIRTLDIHHIADGQDRNVRAESVIVIDGNDHEGSIREIDVAYAAVGAFVAVNASLVAQGREKAA